MQASKENAEIARILLHRNADKLPVGDYHQLMLFIQQCHRRLPSEAAILRNTGPCRKRR
jgi:hypothetical protein